MGTCNLCGKKVKDVPEHIRKTHVGEPMSQDLFNYLKKKGLSSEQMIKHGLNLKNVTHNTLEGYLDG